MSVLTAAIKEEELRRKVSFQEINDLHNLYKSLSGEKDHNIIKEQIKTILISDYTRQEKFDNYIADLKLIGFFALKTNKNAHLFKLAKDLLEAGIDLSSDELLAEQNLDVGAKNRFDDELANATSKLNLLQILLIAGIRSLAEVENLKDLSNLLDNKAYDVMKSPLIQGVTLSEEFNKFDEFSDWFYFNSESQEIYTPNLGYAFGGSRNDPQYHNKEFRMEDCSSAIAKWVNAPGTLATYALKLAYKGECSEDSLCQNAISVLEAKFHNDLIDGDVFVKKSHTGVVTKVINSTCFDTLSYSRDIPKIEGLGYSVTCCEEIDDCLFFREIAGAVPQIEEL